MKVTTSSWHAAKRKLQRDLKKIIRRTPPESWVRRRPLSAPEHRLVPFTIKPPKDNACWTEPIECNVDMFSWPLSEKHRHWLCPALDSVFVSDTLEVTDDFLRQQIANMQTRLSDEWDLEMVQRCFFSRTFRIREVDMWTATQIADAYARRDRQTKKVRVDTLKSVASLMNLWEKDTVYEVDDQVAELDDVLLATKPQSILLVGPSGVGKTAIALKWARSHPEKQVWATSGARLVSGMTGFGMWQKRCQQVIREAEESKSVLHLGSLVELIESGKINGQPGVASMVRGAIERNRITAIAECTPEQLTMIEREDPVLLRSFCKLEIAPPTEEKLKLILGQVGNNLVSGVSFREEAVTEIIHLHQRFSTYSAMPGQPISMMRSMAESWLDGRPIEESDAVERFAKDTGLPLFMLDDKIPLDIDSVRNDLASQVIGQSEPIDRLVELITLLKARLNRRDRPLASLLLIGPTGVGKTETAKALARLLYRDASRMIRIDMSEYAQPWSATRMIGVGSDGNGTLTSPIRDQPFSVVLLDEFEKCHPSVLDLLLQVLGEGRLTDSVGRLADFRNAVIILTSNLGVDSYQGRSFGFGNSGSEAHEHFTREVRRFVRPELLGRLDKIIPYGSLPMETLRSIADRELTKVAMRAGIRHRSNTFSVSESDREKVLASSIDPAYGARPLRREIERQIVIPLADEIATEKGRVRMESRDDVIFYAPSFDLIRDLRYRAALLQRSQPYQSNENNLERLKRLMDRVQSSLERSQRASHHAHGRRQIEVLRTELGEAQKTKAAIDETAAQVDELQREVLEQWLRDNTPPSPNQIVLANALGSQLKEQLIAMQSQSQQRKTRSTLIVVCDPIETVEPLWKAYRKLCELNHWRPTLYRLCVYDPNWDPGSREFGARLASSRATIEIPQERVPAFFLLKGSDIPEERTKLVDVFRVASWDELMSITMPSRGIAFQFDDSDAAHWLAEEEGVHHFLLSNEEGNKRIRARVLLHPGRLVDWNPPADWSEPASLPYRDPRRTYQATTGILQSSLSSYQLVVDEDRPEESWFEMIMQESEARIWSSIGYTPIPQHAWVTSPLRPSKEMPF